MSSTMSEASFFDSGSSFIGARWRNSNKYYDDTITMSESVRDHFWKQKILTLSLFRYSYEPLMVFTFSFCSRTSVHCEIEQQWQLMWKVVGLETNGLKSLGPVIYAFKKKKI